MNKFEALIRALYPFLDIRTEGRQIVIEIDLSIFPGQRPPLRYKLASFAQLWARWRRPYGRFLLHGGSEALFNIDSVPFLYRKPGRLAKPIAPCSVSWIEANDDEISPAKIGAELDLILTLFQDGRPIDRFLERDRLYSEPPEGFARRSRSSILRSTTEPANVLALQ